MSRKDFGYATDGDVFLNESLTFDRSSLMRDVRAKVKSFNAGKVGASRCKLLTDRGVIKVKPRIRGTRRSSVWLMWRTYFDSRSSLTPRSRSALRNI